jgi:MoxR-vWA-beta-propeller ternary system domain bpX5
MKWQWETEIEIPLPMGVMGHGIVSVALLAKLRLLSEAALATLSVAAHRDLLVVTGNHESLPWVDGVQYIASRTDAPGLWFPTTERPSVPLDLLLSAIRKKHTQNPILMCPSPSQLVPLNRLLPANDILLDRIEMLWNS